MLRDRLRPVTACSLIGSGSQDIGDVHELWVVHRANVNARLSDFLLDHIGRFQWNSGQQLLGDCSARSCRPKREHARLTDSGLELKQRAQSIAKECSLARAPIRLQGTVVRADGIITHG